MYEESVFFPSVTSQRNEISASTYVIRRRVYTVLMVEGNISKTKRPIESLTAHY